MFEELPAEHRSRIASKHRSKEASKNAAEKKHPKRTFGTFRTFPRAARMEKLKEKGLGKRGDQEPDSSSG